MVADMTVDRGPSRKIGDVFDHVPSGPASAPRHDRSLAVLAACICAVWLLPGLIGHDPWKPDEAYTFGLVYHVLQGGGLLVPTLAGEPFLDKPPLYLVTAAALARAFSWLLPLHDGARLATGLYLALTMGLVAAAGRELHGPGRGWVAALVFAGSFGLLVRGHQLIPDAALLAGIAAGGYGLALALRRPLAGGLWLGLGAGAGFLAKGLIGPVVLALAAVALGVLARPWRGRAFAGSLAVAMLIAVPVIAAWPMLLRAESAALFAEWLRIDPIARLFFADGTARESARAFYLNVLPWHAWPALPLALWVLWGARVAGFARPALQLPVVLFAATYLVLVLATDGRELHAMAMLVPLALLATPAVDTWRRGAAGALYWFAIMGFTFFAGVFWFYWVGLELGVPARLSTHLHKLQPGYTSGVRWVPLLVAASLTVAWLVLLAAVRRVPERPVIVWTAGMALVWGILMSLFVAYLDTGKSYRSMVASLAAAVSPGECVSSRGLREPQRAMLHYYAGILTHRDEVPARQRACTYLLVQTAGGTGPLVSAEWRLVWDGARPGDDEERFWLYRREGGG